MKRKVHTARIGWMKKSTEVKIIIIHFRQQHFFLFFSKKIRTTRTINANHLSQHKTTKVEVKIWEKEKNCMSTANNLLFDSRQASNGTVRINIRIKQKKNQHTHKACNNSLYGHRQLQPKLQNAKCASTFTQYGIAADGEYTWHHRRPMFTAAQLRHRFKSQFYIHTRTSWMRLWGKC